MLATPDFLYVHNTFYDPKRTVIEITIYGLRNVPTFDDLAILDLLNHTL